MDACALDAITDIDTLRRMVREHRACVAERDATIAAHKHALRERDTLIGKLTYELKRLRRMQFDAKSERMDAVQRGLFDEAIAEDIAAVEAALEAAQAKGSAPVPKAPHAKPQRRTLPSELERVITLHEPDHGDCVDCGAALVKIGEHASEKLDVKPLVFFVRRDVYPQYACRACQSIVAEPVAPAIIDRGLAAPGLLAQVIVQKYVDHLPLYRQEAIFARHGMAFKRTTLSEWMGRAGLALQPLFDALRRQLLVAPVLHADETPVAQLDPGAGKTKRAYLFLYRRAGPHPIVLFDYRPTRAGKHVAAFLGPWKGALMVDDYAGYKALFAKGITELGCWAHARRTFFDAHAGSGSPIAKEAIQHIGEIYTIDNALRKLDPGNRYRERQRLLAPKLVAFKGWLDDLQPKVLGNTGLARAIGYTLKRWNALARILDDGRYPIDNNPAENAIRPIAIGRKNWLFAGSESAGQRAAAIMSLLATAKANGLDSHAWLTDVLTRLPTTLDKHLDSLLPTSWYCPLS